MNRYSYKPTVPAARAAAPGSRVSAKSSALVCRAVSGKQIAKGKQLLEGLLAEKRSIGGRYYTNVAQALLDLVAAAEQNAEQKGLNPERLFIRASAHRGFTFMTPRRMKLRGRARKVANLQVGLEQR